VDTGVDALCHAVEGYICRRSKPIADLLAEDVFRIVREALPTAYRNGGDLDARGSMLVAASIAGMVISHTGTTMVHAMGYHLTLSYGVSHGRANAALIAHGLKYNYDASKEKIGRFYSIFGGASDESGVDAFLDFLHGLGVKTALTDYGLSTEGLDAYREYVMGRSNIRNSPADVTDERMVGLLREIL
jgi:alcohol dehydrogenase class IV